MRYKFTRKIYSFKFNQGLPQNKEKSDQPSQCLFKVLVSTLWSLEKLVSELSMQKQRDFPTNNKINALDQLKRPFYEHQFIYAAKTCKT